MMAVLLTILSILKIIGIIVLAVLVLMIVLVCLVLLAPVVFKVQISHTEEWKAGGSVSWLGFVLRAVFRYDGEVSFAVKVFGIRLFPPKEKPEKQKETKKEPPQEAPSPPQASASEIPEREAASAEAVQPEKKTASEELQRERPAAEKRPEEKKQKEKKPKEKRSKEKKPKEKKPKGKRPEETGSGGSDPLQQIRELLSEGDFGYAVNRIFAVVGGLLGGFRFRELKGEASYSLGAPDLTGMATGVLSMFPVFYGRDLTLTPDFTADGITFDGELSGQGSFRLVHIVIAAVKLISDKRLRKIVHKLGK